MALKAWICSSYSVHSSRSSIVYSLSSRSLTTFVRVGDCRSTRQNLILYPTDSGLPLYWVSGRGWQTTEKSTTSRCRTQCRGFPHYVTRLSELKGGHRKAKKIKRLIFWFISVSQSLRFCVAWKSLLIFYLTLNQVDMLTELCHLLWVYQQRWYEYNMFRSSVINYGNEW